jgi:hypothetical protein
MQTLDHDGASGLVPELAAVARAAGDRLRAETDADPDAAQAAAQALVTAATAAMGAGHSLSEITQAETWGKEDVRDALRGDTLRSVERSGRRAREARIEHHESIARAMRLGLSTREIATAAGVTHGTVRAIGNRLSGAGAGDGSAGAQAEEGDLEAMNEGDPGTLMYGDGG